MLSPVLSCPGTDTCKLGIAPSRGLAGELRRRLSAVIERLRIKVSGCFNSYGQHHAADIGFYCNIRKVNGITVPYFQVVLGGRCKENAGSFGLTTGAITSKNIPEAVARLGNRFVAERDKDKLFKNFIARLGKREIKAMPEDLTQVPTYEKIAGFVLGLGRCPQVLHGRSRYRRVRRRGCGGGHHGDCRCQTRGFRGLCSPRRRPTRSHLERRPMRCCAPLALWLENSCMMCQKRPRGSNRVSQPFLR